MQCLKADSVEINFQVGQQLFQLNFRDIDFLLLERIALFVGPSLTKFAALYVACTVYIVHILVIKRKLG